MKDIAQESQHSEEDTIKIVSSCILLYNWAGGAMVARLTPDQKVANSIFVRLNTWFHFLKLPESKEFDKHFGSLILIKFR